MIPLYKFQTNYKNCLTDKKLFGNDLREMKDHFRGWIDWLDSSEKEYNVYVRTNITKVTFAIGTKKYKAEWITY